MNFKTYITEGTNLVLVKNAKSLYKVKIKKPIFEVTAIDAMGGKRLIANTLPRSIGELKMMFADSSTMNYTWIINGESSINPIYGNQRKWEKLIIDAYVKISTRLAMEHTKTFKLAKDLKANREYNAGFNKERMTFKTDYEDVVVKKGAIITIEDWNDLFYFREKDGRRSQVKSTSANKLIANGSIIPMIEKIR